MDEGKLTALKPWFIFSRIMGTLSSSKGKRPVIMENKMMPRLHTSQGPPSYGFSFDTTSGAAYSNVPQKVSKRDPGWPLLLSPKSGMIK